MVHSGRLWQLLCNYIQERQTNMRIKTGKRKRKEEKYKGQIKKRKQNKNEKEIKN